MKHFKSGRENSEAAGDFDRTGTLNSEKSAHSMDHSHTSKRFSKAEKMRSEEHCENVAPLGKDSVEHRQKGRR